LALALCPQVTWALSCVAPDLARDFLWHQERESRYVVLMGSIEVDRENETVVPHPEYDSENFHYPAMFSGAYLTEDGFRFGYSADLTVSICKGQWCQGLPGTEEGIYFVEATDEGLFFFRNECNFTFPATAANRRLIERRMAGEYCQPEN